VKIETGLDTNRNNVLDATEINANQTRYICNGLDGAAGGGGAGQMAYATGSGPNPSTTLTFLAPAATVSVSSGQQVLVISNRVLGTNSPTGAGDLELAICYQREDGESPLTVVEGSQLHDLGINQYDRFPFGLSAVIENLSTGTYQVGLCGFTERGSTTANAWNYNEGGSTSALVSGESIGDRSDSTERLESTATPTASTTPEIEATPTEITATPTGTSETPKARIYLPLW
jgi:hypothetical protein